MRRTTLFVAAVVLAGNGCGQTAAKPDSKANITSAANVAPVDPFRNAQPAATTAGAAESPGKAPSKDAAKAQRVLDGEELFAREWLPNDSRAHGGDGLGPVFNDSSCIACHNQGGAGGAGPTSKNVDIVTAFPLPQRMAPQPSPPASQPEGLSDNPFSEPTPPAFLRHANAGKAAAAHKPTAAEEKEALKLAREQITKELMKIHPGFASARSVVLHHFGTDPRYQHWRTNALLGRPQPIINNTDPFGDSTGPSPTPVPRTTFGPPAASFRANAEVAAVKNEVRIKQRSILSTTFQTRTVRFSHSQRNPIALFGDGLIDAIPEQAIVELAKTEHEKYPDVAGRPAKQKDGKIGRFGWKAQKPSLEDFALTACAVELGLNVPGHQQAGVPLKPDYKAPGLDMNQAECDALVSYLRSLPPPAERKPATAQESATISAGHKLFASVGCANCHAEKVGAIGGLYSDLLLHDMGPELGDSGNYGVFTPDAPEEDQDDSPPPVAGTPAIDPFGCDVQPAQPKTTPPQLAKLVGALRQEWRTAPLWGVRDSGPYLHDGRADTLEQAIVFHGGQAADTTLKFFQLQPEERAQVITFLKSLTAPEPAPKTVKLAAQ